MKGDNSAMLGKISAISDDNRLLEIFKGSDDFEIRYAIVNLICDDGILYEIFSAEENPFIKSIALNRISTDILDFDDFNSLDGDEKITYIEKCNDEPLFYEVAQNDSDFYVRTAAIYRISDMGLLSKMAESCTDYDTRVVCYYKLSGQPIMDEIRAENLAESRVSLVKSLDNEKFIEDILINDRECDVQIAALKRLIGDEFYFTVLKDALVHGDFTSLYDKISFIEKASDESALFGLAENDENFHVRVAAISRISDWNFLSKMADSHPDYDTRFVLYKKLNGMSFLDEITEENLLQSHKSLVKRLDNENFLKDIAVNDSSIDVKLAALKKLDKPDFYLSIMENTSDENELRQLVGDIRDESQLFDLAVFNSSSNAVVKNAINNIANPSLLFELYRSGGSLVRKTAMRKLVFGNVFSNERIADNISIDRIILSVCTEDVLVDIVKNDSGWSARKAIVECIDDEEVLAYVAMNDSSARIRKDAVVRIGDDDVLEDVAMNDSEQRCRAEAVRRIGDEDILVDIAHNSSDAYIRRVAVGRIDDADVLADVAMNDSEGHVRKAAVERIDDDAVLVDIARNNSSDDIRRLAARKIGRKDILIEIACSDSGGEGIYDADDNALADIAMNGSDLDDRCQAVQILTDEEVLFDIAMNCNDYRVSIEAVLNITDDDSLIYIARNSDDCSVRIYAARKINDKNALAEIALGSHVWEVRLEAVKKVDDDDVLEEVFRKDSEREIRREALRRIRGADTLKRLLLENYGYFSLESFKEFERDYDKMIYESMGTEIYDDILDNISDESVLAQLVHEKLFGDFRVLAVRRITSSDVLRDLALNDLDYRLRREAIRNPNLSDEETFVRIFQTDCNDAVRLEALKQIGNPDFLEDIANDLNPVFRTYALERLGRTFEPNEDAVSFDDIDLTSIEKIEDENVLCAMAIHAPASSIRRYAFERITDEHVLAKLVCYSREFANMALNMIDDKELLLNIALYCNDPTAQRKAVKRIDDEEFLLEAVQANPYNDISQYVVDRIRDESRLEIIAFNNSNPFNRKAAVNKIQSPDIIMRLGEVECEEMVCTAIVKKCRDKGLLEYVGLSNPCKTVRRYVGSITDDDELLYRFALKEFEYDNRRELISRLDNEEYILNLLKRETVDRVFRKNYYNRTDFKITDEEMLIDLAKNSVSYAAKDFAFEKMKMPVLMDYVYSSPFTSNAPKYNSMWENYRYGRYDKMRVISIMAGEDFNDMKLIEDFLIGNEIEQCRQLRDISERVWEIPSIYRIVLNCKSENVRKLFKPKLEYRTNNHGRRRNGGNEERVIDEDEKKALEIFGALFGDNYCRGDDNGEAASEGLGALFGDDYGRGDDDENSIMSNLDFNDLKVIEEFLIENEIEQCEQLNNISEKVWEIPSIYRIVLNCKSENVRNLFEPKLEYGANKS